MAEIDPAQRLQWAEEDYRYCATHLQDCQQRLTEAEKQFDRAKAELDDARLEYNRHEVEARMAHFVNGS